MRFTFPAPEVLPTPLALGGVFLLLLSAGLLLSGGTGTGIAAVLQRFPAVWQRISSRSRSLSSSSSRLLGSLWSCAAGAPAASAGNRQSYLVRSSAVACSAESPHQPFAELQNWYSAQLAFAEQSHLAPSNRGPHRP